MENQDLVIFKSAVKEVENQFIALKPCCEFFELDYKYQVERVRTDFLMGQLVGKNPLVAADGKERDMVSLPKSGFLRWAYTLNPNNIAENHRQNFIKFVTLIHEYLFGDKNPSELAKKKQERLFKLKEDEGLLEEKIRTLKKNTIQLQSDLKKKNKEFWEVFNSDPNQLSIES